MIIKKYGVALSLLMASLFSFSQTKLPSMTVKDIDKSTAFEELIELLADSDYFIQNVNKEIGFIQVKFVIKGKGLFAKNDGDRLIYNILLKTLDNNSVLIKLQANIEDRDWSSQVKGWSYHYQDEGVSNDSKDYEELLTLIESHFENQ